MVVGEAEAAWPGVRVALLLPEQAAGADAFRAAGWRVFTGTEDGAGIVAALAEES